MPNFIDPRMQMPRGDGFGQQGGYRGQVYNSPQQSLTKNMPYVYDPNKPQPDPSSLVQNMPYTYDPSQNIDPKSFVRNMPNVMRPQQNGMGRMYPQLSQDIAVFRKNQRQQEVERELQQMFMQEKMKGMLGE